MHTVIFVTAVKRRSWYVALCQCGAPHGPSAKVAMIPPPCQGCEQKALVNERKISA
jgi:hypothetical protein